jgi:hypothetical protein
MTKQDLYASLSGQSRHNIVANRASPREIVSIDGKLYTRLMPSYIHMVTVNGTVIHSGKVLVPYINQLQLGHSPGVFWNLGISSRTDFPCRIFFSDRKNINSTNIYVTVAYTSYSNVPYYLAGNTGTIEWVTPHRMINLCKKVFGTVCIPYGTYVFDTSTMDSHPSDFRKPIGSNYTMKTETLSYLLSSRGHSLALFWSCRAENHWHCVIPNRLS